MTRRLPPLNALRAFEAAARHQSFTRAAVELCVTHGAVSRHVQGLEAWLGDPLFRRTNRQVILTPAGVTYLAEIGPALDRIAAATDRVHSARTHRVLLVNALPTFTIRWLIPRLSAFQIAHPTIEIRLSTASEAVDQVREPFDLVIRGGPENWRGWHCEKFLAERRIPVCSPALRRRLKLAVPADLAGHSLIHSQTLPDVWPKWLAAAGLAGLEPARHLFFEHFYQTLQAAQDDVGVAIGPLALVAGDLAVGRLCLPFDGPTLPARGYYLYQPDAKAGDPTIDIFRRWLKEAGRAAETEALPPATG